MTTTDPVVGLLDTTAALVDGRLVADALADLLRTCAATVGAGAAGVMVVDGTGELQLLASLTHRAEELELYQLQSGEGPCVDVARGPGVQVHESGAASIAARWPTVGPAIVAAGFTDAHGFPLRWPGRTLGALNLMFEAGPVPAEQLALGQAFADLAALLVLHPEPISVDEAGAKVELALTGRAVVERAKGVLAQEQGLDMDQAYEQLARDAVAAGRPMSEVASEVLARVTRRAD